jgi:UDP-3-O-[3-hydroxymyristoyl] glucosamine N-acyltransferase
MKLPEPISISTLADYIGAEIIGDTDILITGINEIHKVEEGDITFSDLPKYFQKSLSSKASAVILNEEVPCPPNKAILVHPEPFQAYDKLIRRFRPFNPLSQQISETAVIGKNTIIEPNVVIGNHVVIGDNCYIQANVYIGDYTIIGNNVTLQPGCIIASDAFYCKRYADHYQRWTTGGRVVIGDHVDIGGGCTINSGVSGDTVIGSGTKFDCQIHIGHDAVIGKNCLFAAQVGVGGNTIIEDNVVLYGQVGVAQNLRIGRGAVVMAKSGVSKNLEPDKVYLDIRHLRLRINIKNWRLLDYYLKW